MGFLFPKGGAMRFILALIILPLAATAAAAQDNYDLANALSNRGWFDVAEDLFTEIKNNAGLPSEERAEGVYGLARVKIAKAERAPSSEKSALFDAAIKEIESFREKYPNHRREGEGRMARAAADVEHALVAAEPHGPDHRVEVRTTAVHLAHHVGGSRRPELLLDRLAQVHARILCLSDVN